MSNLLDMFIASKDSETHRICGTCGESEPFEHFYKDGKDNQGKTKYRRDCKTCYKRTRITEATFKKKGSAKK